MSNHPTNFRFISLVRSVLFRDTWEGLELSTRYGTELPMARSTIMHGDCIDAVSVQPSLGGCYE